MTTYEVACQYLALGLSVIPIEPNGKKPLGKWKQYQERLMTPGEAKILFKEGYNIGLVCGKISNLIVVDLDSYKKESGITIDSPVMVYTPRGGTHVYLKYQHLGNTANADIATDIRGDGGFVVVPHSSIDGNLYRWKVEPTKEMLEALPELPEEIKNKIYKLAEKQPNGQGEKFQVASALNISEGGRNDTLHRLALSLLSKHKEDEAWTLLVAANNTANPPLPENELRTLFRSACQRNKVSPPIKAAYRVQENNDFKYRTFNQMVDDAKQYIIEGKKIGIRSGFPSMDEITGGFQLGQSYLGFADTSVGKSIWLLNMLLYMAQRGEKVMYFDLENSFESMTAERLMLILMQGDLTKQEWELMGKQEKADLLESLKGLPFSMWDQGQLGDRFGNVVWKDGDGKGVINCIEEGIKEGCRVFAIDHLHYFDGPDTDFSRLSAVAKDINDICARYNVCIIMVAHTKKGLITEKNGQVKAGRPTVDHVSGSGMISRHTKNVIGLHRNHQAEVLDEQKVLTVYVDKTKNGPTGQVVMDFNPYSLVITDYGHYPPEPAPKQEKLLEPTPEPKQEEVMEKKAVFMMDH